MVTWPAAFFEAEPGCGVWFDAVGVDIVRMALELSHMRGVVVRKCLEDEARFPRGTLHVRCANSRGRIKLDPHLLSQKEGELSLEA